MDNSGLLKFKMQWVKEQFQHLRKRFYLVIDFCKFCFKPILDDFNDIDNRKYVETVHFLLKDEKSTLLGT